MPFDGSRAELYRQYAERIRTQATNPKAKEIFEEIARLYDMLATGVERRFSKASGATEACT
jgi:hypothetical protein